MDEATEVMRLCPNGDVYVKGRLVTTDKEITDGLREWDIAARALGEKGTP